MKSYIQGIITGASIVFSFFIFSGQTNIELSKISEETAREALDLTQTSYNNGAVNIVQLLDAQNNYLKTQLASTNAVYNYLIINLKLERYLGYFFLLNSEEDNQAFRQRFLDFIESQK